VSTSNQSNTVPTTFNMDVDLKTKAQLYVTMYNANLRKSGKAEEKISLSQLLNEALRKRLENVEIR